MLSHPSSSGFQHKLLTDAAISRLKAKFMSLHEVMKRDGVSVQIGPSIDQSNFYVIRLE